MSNYSETSRFAVIRPAKQISSSHENLGFSFYPESATQTIFSAIQQPGSRWSDILATAGQRESQILTDMIQGNPPPPSLEQMDLIYEWMVNCNFQFTSLSFEGILKNHNLNMVQALAQHADYWDGFFAALLLGRPAGTRQSWIHALRILHVYKLIQEHPRLDSSHLETAARSTMVLPAVFDELKQKSRGEDPELQPISGQQRGSGWLIGGGVFESTDLCPQLSVMNPCAPYPYEGMPEWNPAMFRIRNIGFAEYMIVRHQLWKYTLGEIAHVENVMRTEKRDREHVHLSRTETSFTESTENITVNETDLNTSDRSNLQKESTEVLKTMIDVTANVEGGVNAEAGPYINVGAGFALSDSQEHTQKMASEVAREVTARAVKSITEKSFREKRTTQTEETTETNRHSFDNITDDHISGIYQYVDKHYRSNVFSVGPRMLFEAVVPEPAAFFIYRQFFGLNAEVEMPRPPEALGLNSYNDIVLVPPALGETGWQPNAQYMAWAAEYGVFDVPAPPDYRKTIFASMAMEKPDHTDSFVKMTDVLSIPAGYYTAIIQTRGWVKSPGVAHVLAGMYDFTSVAQDVFENAASGTDQASVMEVDNIPVTVNVIENNGFNVNIRAICHPTDDTLNKWKREVYAAIIQGYELKLAEYQRKLDAAQASGVRIEGSNPESNRRTELQELKRACIELMTGQRFEAFHAMTASAAPSGYPAFHFDQAVAEGRFVQFIEQAIEWDVISYKFYDYFWGRKPNWINMLKLRDPDPQFENFMRAGSARVILPVRSGFEEAIAYFATTGLIWEGNDPPVINDPQFVSIIQEIKESEGQFNAHAWDEAWELKIPTQMVMLRPKEAGLGNCTPQQFCVAQFPLEDGFLFNSEMTLTVTGVVDGFDDPGTGLAGASVTATNDQIIRTAVTDSTGSYTLNLPAGTFEIVVSMIGYNDNTAPAVVLSSGNSPLTHDVTLIP